MSDEFDRDDTTLGTALARAVESQPVRETPFERSRLAARIAAPRRSPFVPALAAAAAILAGLALGAAVLGLRSPGPVATQPPAATSTPAATVTPSAGPTRALRVFFARDLLPPIGAEVQVPLASDATPEQRIRARLEALVTASAPSGTANALASSRTKPTVREVRIDGDLARVDWNVPNSDWGVGGTAGQLGLEQQLVYTATEEPGIRRLVLTENGGQPTTVFTGHGLPNDTPLSREDVFGYSFIGTEVPSIDFAGGSDALLDVTKFGTANDRPPGLGRFSIDLRPRSGSGRLDPAFTAQLTRSGDTGPFPGKWAISIVLPRGTWQTSGPQQYSQIFDGTPIRAAKGGPIQGGGVGFTIFLDDARPWRVVLNPAADGTTELFLDVGGAPQAVNRNIAVDLPSAGPAARSFGIFGAARVFEANVAWRIRDSKGTEAASGHTLASIGTSQVWGTFSAVIAVPASVSGAVTLEVFWISPKDGGDQDVVKIPLTIP